MQCAIVYIRGDGLAFVTGASSILLFLRKPVLLMRSVLTIHCPYDAAYLWCSNHALFLCASSDETTADASKIWVGTKTFPVPTTACDSSNRADEWAESNVNALSSVLSTESMAISEHEISIERSSKMNASRE